MNTPKRVTLEMAKKLVGTMGIRDELEQRVVDHIDARKPISRDAHEQAILDQSKWDSLADGVARVGGSWPFIGGFFAFLLCWTGINTWLLTAGSAFDPYPFIFLNLILSMLAAIQAPIIMMSQNRQGEKDRVAASLDYEVNLRSEIEILAMQQKLDHLRGEQHEMMLKHQAEMLDILKQVLLQTARK